MEYPFREGAVVAATRTITENGEPPGDPEAKPLEPQYIHARMGDVGEVEGVDDETPTVRFMNSGTATIVGKDEVIFVAPTMEDYKAGHEEWRQQQIAIQKLEEAGVTPYLAELIDVMSLVIEPEQMPHLDDLKKLTTAERADIAFWCGAVHMEAASETNEQRVGPAPEVLRAILPEGAFYKNWRLERSHKPKDLVEAIISMVTDECRCPDSCPVHDHHLDGKSAPPPAVPEDQLPTDWSRVQLQDYLESRGFAVYETEDTEKLREAVRLDMIEEAVSQKRAPFRMVPLPKGTTFNQAYPDAHPSLGPGGVCRVCGAETEMVPRESLPERLRKHLGSERYLWCPQCTNLSMFPGPEPGPKRAVPFPWDTDENYFVSMGAAAPKPRCPLCEAGVPKKEVGDPNVQEARMGTLTGDLLPNDGVLLCWNCSFGNDIHELYAAKRELNVLRCQRCRARVGGYNHIVDGWCRAEADEVRKAKRESNMKTTFGANYMIQSEFAAKAMRRLRDMLTPEQQAELDATGMVTFTEESAQKAIFDRKIPLMQVDYSELELRAASHLAQQSPCKGCKNFPGMLRGESCEGCDHWPFARAAYQAQKPAIHFEPNFRIPIDDLKEASEKYQGLTELIDKQLSDAALSDLAKFYYNEFQRQRRAWKALRFGDHYGSPSWLKALPEIFNNYKEAARRSPEAWRKDEEADQEEEAAPKPDGSEGEGEES